MLPHRICHQSFRSPFAAVSCTPPTMASNPLSPSIVVVVADNIPAPPGDDGMGGGPSDDDDGAAQPPTSSAPPPPHRCRWDRCWQRICTTLPSAPCCCPPPYSLSTLSSLTCDCWPPCSLLHCLCRRYRTLLSAPPSRGALTGEPVPARCLLPPPSSLLSWRGGGANVHRAGVNCSCATWHCLSGTDNRGHSNK